MREQPTFAQDRQQVSDEKRCRELEAKATHSQHECVCVFPRVCERVCVQWRPEVAVDTSPLGEGRFLLKVKTRLAEWQVTTLYCSRLELHDALRLARPNANVIPPVYSIDGEEQPGLL